MEKHRVIGIGETVYDIIFKDNQPLAAVPGGSSFNAIISLGRLGVPCVMVTETGDDHVGDITCEYLRQNGVSDEFVNRMKGTRSHLSLAFLNEQNDANYTFYKDHPSASLSKHVPEINGSDAVLFGSFFAINPKIRPTVLQMLHTANDAGATIYYDVNFRASHLDELKDVLPSLIENMKLATIVRGSTEDFNYIFGTKDADELYEKHIPCDCFILTDAGNPIELRTPKVKASFPVARIDTVSTVGAGDNFNAGILYSLQSFDNIPDPNELTLEQWEKIITTAQLFSADVCQQLGNSVSHEFAAEIRSRSAL